MPGLLSLVLLVMPAVLVAAEPCGAQVNGATEAELQSENDRLRVLVQDLQRELEAAKARIKALEEQLARGGTSADTGTSSGSNSTPPPLTDQFPPEGTDPGSSPLALLAELQRDYDLALAGQPSWQASSRDRTTYLRAVERWITAANRRYRTRIEWLVRVLPDTWRPMERGRERGGVVLTQAVDVTTGESLGAPFETFLPNVALRRLDEQRLRHSDALWRLRGTLIPGMQFNAELSQSGPFDRPTLVGPFAVFNFGVDAVSIVEGQLEPAPPSTGATPTDASPDQSPAQQPAGGASDTGDAGDMNESTGGNGGNGGGAGGDGAGVGGGAGGAGGSGS